MAAALEGAARGGAAATAALVVQLFGAELKEETQRMATFSQQDSAASVAGASSG
jgi:hypothetical protein